MTVDFYWFDFENSDRSCNLTGTKAASAGINSLRRAVYDCLNLFYVRLPRSV